MNLVIKKNYATPKSPYKLQLVWFLLYLAPALCLDHKFISTVTVVHLSILSETAPHHCTPGETTKSVTGKGCDLSAFHLQICTFKCLKRGEIIFSLTACVVGISKSSKDPWPHFLWVTLSLPTVQHKGGAVPEPSNPCFLWPEFQGSQLAELCLLITVQRGRTGRHCCVLPGCYRGTLSETQQQWESGAYWEHCLPEEINRSIMDPTILQLLVCPLHGKKNPDFW